MILEDIISMNYLNNGINRHVNTDRQYHNKVRGGITQVMLHSKDFSVLIYCQHERSWNPFN